MDISLFKNEAEIPPHCLWQAERAEVPQILETDVFSPIELRYGSLLRTVRLGGYTPLKVNAALEMLQRANEAFNSGRGDWAFAHYKDRVQATLQFADDLEMIEEALALSIMWAIAKPWQDSLAEVRRTVNYIRDTCQTYATLCAEEDQALTANGFYTKARMAPLGTVLCMGPFHNPLFESCTTLIPALLTGNSVLLKAPRFGVLLHQRVLPLYARHFPKGVVGVLFGDGRALIIPVMRTGKIDALACIGSGAVANTMTRYHPQPHCLRCVRGLGAKNVAIVCSDADTSLAAKECAQGALAFNGQHCTALKMHFVHDSVYERFLEAFIEAVESMKIGMPWEDGVQITPLAEPNKTEWLEELKENAISLGAKWVNAPARGTPCRLGNLYLPAILSDVPNAAKLAQVEQFGPLIPVRRFSDVREPVTYVEESPYRQQASVFGQAAEAAWIVDALSPLLSGVNINAQCGRRPDTFAFGDRKDFAAGILSIRDGLRAFSVSSSVSVKSDAERSEAGAIRSLLRGGNRFLRAQSLEPRPSELPWQNQA
jgi:glyceraldehyde-3-phosphate dehydrogenase (NADP+)